MSKTLEMIKEHNAKWVDLRFTDTKGKEQHVTFPVSKVDESFLEGMMFDGSSVAGWKGINESDMILRPDDSTAVLDPFADEIQINLRCDIIEPRTMQGYNRDPRSVARRAEEFLKSTGIGDKAFFGPENEFFVFDDIKWHVGMDRSYFQIGSDEAAWSSDKKIEGGNMGHRNRVKGGYFPVPPVDSLHDLRGAMCDTMASMGLDVELHHHEVANAGQCEIGTRFNSLVAKADETQTLKYCIWNTAHAYGKTATFMPKPLVGDNGSGMHVHMSIWKDGKNTFAGDGYAGLSETALYYIGGIIKHAKALNAFGNASTNSYKRLVKGFEAPTLLAYSSRNRSASIRIPYILGGNPKAIRIEVRFGDNTANPYLYFAALMMAGVDGIQNKIHPGDPASKDLYDLEPEEEALIPKVCYSLDEALDSLDADRDFLKKGGVFCDDLIDAYIELKRQDCTRLNMSTHPVEFDMYYSL
ncbi:MAG: type I glutamate--ammonia ligase [Pseudohongiella sp.]|nr:type I glutamate--ammonia ligase [Pseudohongiella sp.]MDO9520447.1 type I glutamate--ammonia ligase [Pseudohongiella sp.]MDP2126545.1 type I glutamate--ammonia ligase [Pseudohongiella sp.]